MNEHKPHAQARAGRIAFSEIWSGRGDSFALIRMRELFGANLRRLRTSKGWTQEELAGEARISREYVSRIETGQENVTLDMIETLSKALAAAPNELFVSPKGSRRS